MATIRKKIEIESEKVVMPPGQNVRHISTSYQISSAIDFSDANIVHQRLKDQNNLYKYVIELDLSDTETYFVRTKYHYTVDGVQKDGTWTRAVMLDSDTSKPNMSAYVVATPRLTTNYTSNLNKLDINTSSFQMFAGIALHTATSYKIVNSDNMILYKRIRDEENLESLEVIGKIQPNKLFSIEAAHVDDLGNSSFFGKNLLFNYSRFSKLYTFEIAETLVAERKLYFKINIFTPKYKSYDLEIRDIYGDVIIAIHDENKWTKETISYLDLGDPSIYKPGKKFEITKEYIIYMKLYFTDNTETKFEEVYRGRIEFNRLTTYKPLIKYSNRRVKGNDLMTDGITCSITRELFDGKIIASLYKDNKLGLFTNEIGKHVKIKDLFDFEGIKIGLGFEASDSLQVDYMNIFQLPTHDVLIDVCLFNGNDQSKSAFFIFEYDPFRMALSKDYIIIPRDKEKYNTSPCNSLAICTNNDIYYVPSYLTDGNTDARQDLVMYKFNVKDEFFVNETSKGKAGENNPEIEFGNIVQAKPEEIKLPFQAKTNVGVVCDADNNIFLFGGSVTPRNTTDTFAEYWNRENNNIYKLNKENKTWDRVAEFPNNWSLDIYAMQAILRVNGEIAFFNSSVGGPATEIQDICVFNPKNYNIQKVNTDHSWNIPFRSNIIYANGNIERISSNPKDPQKSVIFVANTQPAGSVDLDGNINESLDLVVEDGETVNIEDIYKYRNITIKGTGILRWYRPQGITDIDSHCLIINTDTILEQLDFEDGQYQSILLLDGNEFLVQA